MLPMGPEIAFFSLRSGAHTLVVLATSRIVLVLGRHGHLGPALVAIVSVAPVAGLLPRFPASRTTMPDDSLRPLLRHRIVVSAPGRLLALPGLV